VGYVEGKAVSFYNLGSVATAALPVLKAAALPAVFDIAPDHCSSARPYDPLLDAYDPAVQLPIFTALPLATKVAGAVVTPFVSVVPIVSYSPFACNAVKDAADVAYAGSSSAKYQLSAADSGEARMRAVIDPTAPLAPGTPDLTLKASLGWYKDLLLTWLDGGPVPLNEKGELQAMDGVILDPAGSTASAKFTDPKVVLLPFSFGEAGYSPIVRLHAFRLPAGKVAGDFTGLCKGTTCGPKDVNLTLASATSTSTIFIVSQ
jgi:hypothetical protein